MEDGGLIMNDFDNLKLQVEALSGGKNTVLLDDLGMPSIMVRIPKFKICDVIEGGPDVTHPAFIINGVEKDVLYISKYQNIIMKDRAYSLPYKDPSVFMTYDQANQYCENKGKGWHLMTNAEWAAIALWSKKNGTTPRGNNNHGGAHDASHEKGVITYYNGKTPCRVATGSGPASWSHDGTNEGIFDLNGNIWEYVSGVRIKAGEIHIIPDNDAAQSHDQTKDSHFWKAILSDNSIVSPGTEDTLKYYTKDKNDSGIGTALLNTYIDHDGTEESTMVCPYESISKANSIDDPILLKALCLYPTEQTNRTDVFWANTGGERIPIRGGYWVNGSQAGIFALGFGLTREESYFDVGCRCCYYDY